MRGTADKYPCKCTFTLTLTEDAERCLKVCPATARGRDIAARVQRAIEGDCHHEEGPSGMSRTQSKRRARAVAADRGEDEEGYQEDDDDDLWMLTV